MPIKILVVEDDKDIRQLLKEFLESDGYNVITVGDGLQGYEKFKSINFNLVILDIMMPKIDGFTLCEMIRNENKLIPIIILTALDDEDNELKGFNLNIDDYIEKPFSVKVLLKRVENVLRRCKLSILSTSNLYTSIKYKDLELNNKAFSVTLNNTVTNLTIKEYELLQFLINNKGKILSRETIYEAVWGNEIYNDSRVIDTHIKNLRKKLNIQYIKTIRGIGYEMAE